MKKEYILKEENLREIKDRIILELYKERKKSKLTQSCISEKTNLPQTTISRVESLSFDVKLDTLIKYAEALGLELSINLSKKEITKTYLIACKNGGIVEMPEINFSDFQYINASSEEEALEIYNLSNECIYFKGFCIGILNDNGNILIKENLISKILNNIDTLDEENNFYLLASISDAYWWLNDDVSRMPTFGNFKILKSENDKVEEIQNKINSHVIIGKYDKNYHTFEVPKKYIRMITNLLKELKYINIENMNKKENISRKLELK